MNIDGQGARARAERVPSAQQSLRRRPPLGALVLVLLGHGL